ncbi:MBL fold metallo-hydrolase, partial [Candidatus Micrarchaeota archaeon CG10_big_fil_rev_8_21_14_0_10_45_29]
MLSLTFYGGANEIGGNKILLEDKDAKIYLDFGQSFNFGKDYFYDWLQPRSVNGLEVMFEFNLMPKIEKLYSSNSLAYTDLKYQQPNIDAVFISHSHSDHVNHIQYLDENIPIYMGHGTKVILDAYAQLYPQFCKLGEHKYSLFKSGDKIKIKHLIIEPIHVEHSIPGAYGFIITTSKGKIIYTGDFRLHGPKESYSREFIEKAKQAKPYAMLCEGTRMSAESRENFSEEGVERKIDGIISGSKGIVFAYFSMSNVDRFFSFYRAAKKSGRTLVIDTKFAFILDSLREKITELPDPKRDKLLKVYFRLAKSGTFNEKDYYKYEREYMENMITYKELE